MQILIDNLKRIDNVFKDVATVIDNGLVAKQECAIVLPFRYVQANLLELGRTNYTVTIFPIVNNKNQYSVTSMCSLMEIQPSSIDVTKHNGEEHYVFLFDKGDVITPSLDLIKDDNIGYKIYDEFIQKAKVPWFLNYQDVGFIMQTVESHTGVRLSDTNAIFEIVVATLSRNKDLSKYYREVITSLDRKELEANPLNSITLNSVIHATVNKMNKMMGGYIEDGLTSALTETKNSRSGVEELLRKN